MIQITSSDAYALALISQFPKKNEDLVDTLSDVAKPIGLGLIGEYKGDDKDVISTVETLKRWAKCSNKLAKKKNKFWSSKND